MESLKKLSKIALFCVVACTMVTSSEAFLQPRPQLPAVSSSFVFQVATPVTRRLKKLATLRAANGDRDEKNTGRKDSKDESEESMQLDWNKVSKQTKLFWSMASPYFQESKSGRWLFAGMIGLTLLNSGVSVAFSYLGKDFWNALSAKDAEQFYFVLSKYVGALLVGAPIVTLYKFQRERLAVHWREWMTDRTLQLYEEQRVYYTLEQYSRNTQIQKNSEQKLEDAEGASSTSATFIDNPDQRISEDVKSFTQFSLQLALQLITSVIDLVNFSLILYSIYPQLFIAIIAYAIFGTVCTTILGKDLVRLNYDQLQKEADFRYSLVRLRENAESIAFYAGENLEGRAIGQRLSRVINNSRDIIGAQRNLEFFTNGYRFMIQLLPVTVVAPRYFAGAIELGVISQSVGAFNHILSDLSIIVNQFEQLSRFSAGIDRLAQFLSAVRTSNPERPESEPLLKLSNATQTKIGDPSRINTYESTSIDNGTGKKLFASSFGTIDLVQRLPVIADDIGSVPPSEEPILSMDRIDLCTPDRQRVLIRNLSAQIQEGDHLLIVGNSGAGKSSLLRAIAGLWTAGNGRIERPSDDDVYFLPQRPYCALGSLKDQLLYPSIESLDSITGDVSLPKIPRERPKTNLEERIVTQAHIMKKSLTDEDLLEVLVQVDLGELAARAGQGDPRKGLRAALDWSNTLSLGEQQRLAFARVLVNRPRLVILDEATSALDMVAEARMYNLLQNLARKKINSGGKISAPGLTYVSVGHRPSLLAYHSKRLRLGGDDEHKLEVIENVPKLNVSNL